VVQSTFLEHGFQVCDHYWPREIYLGIIQKTTGLPPGLFAPVLLLSAGGSTIPLIARRPLHVLHNRLPFVPSTFKYLKLDVRVAIQAHKVHRLAPRSFSTILPGLRIRLFPSGRLPNAVSTPALSSQGIHTRSKGQVLLTKLRPRLHDSRHGSMPKYPRDDMSIQSGPYRPHAHNRSSVHHAADLMMGRQRSDHRKNNETLIVRVGSQHTGYMCFEHYANHQRIESPTPDNSQKPPRTHYYV